MTARNMDPGACIATGALRFTARSTVISLIRPPPCFDRRIADRPGPDIGSSPHSVAEDNG